MQERSMDDTKRHMFHHHYPSRLLSNIIKKSQSVYINEQLYAKVRESGKIRFPIQEKFADDVIIETNEPFQSTITPHPP